MGAALLLGATLGLAACGSSSEQPAARDRAPAPGTERSEDPQTLEPGGDFSAPRAARTASGATVPARRGMRIASSAKSDLTWSATGKQEGTEFCVRVNIPVNDPAADCSSGTLLALQFFSNQSVGRAVASVDQAAVDKRSATTQLIVSGVASGDVRSVVVRYAQRDYEATLSTKNVQLPVEKGLARELSGATKAQQARLPAKVTVRIFAVSFERDTGNPPATVEPTTRKPVDGRVTLALS